MTQAKPVRRPCEPGVELESVVAVLAPPMRYGQVVGKLVLLAGCTRPDNMQPVAALVRYLALPRESDWRATKHQLRYLHGTVALDLRYHGPRPKGARGSAAGELPVQGLPEANYAGCKDTLRSTRGLLRW
jgi:hypothetical protein